MRRVGFGGMTPIQLIVTLIFTAPTLAACFCCVALAKTEAKFNTEN